MAAVTNWVDMDYNESRKKLRKAEFLEWTCTAAYETATSVAKGLPDDVRAIIIYEEHIGYEVWAKGCSIPPPEPY